METTFDGLLWFTVVSVGIMAGVYFTFSVFVMRSLDAMDPPAGMLAMQSINRVIVRTLFLPIFFGSSLASAALVIFAIASPDLAGAEFALWGGAIYFLGMFLVTIVGNVPLNNRLEATDASGTDGSRMWQEYLSKWTMWNHVRTIACTASMVLLILAIASRF